MSEKSDTARVCGPLSEPSDNAVRAKTARRAPRCRFGALAGRNRRCKPSDRRRAALGTALELKRVRRVDAVRARRANKDRRLA